MKKPRFTGLAVEIGKLEGEQGCARVDYSKWQKKFYGENAGPTVTVIQTGEKIKIICAAYENGVCEFNNGSCGQDDGDPDVEITKQGIVKGIPRGKITLS
ncbi:hypothetical protein K9M41_01340 [Candidatus Gracilibacteria bacterium]|nr:hypothetical protein [Candidatus Gracilibacteria bacterium]